VQQLQQQVLQLSPQLSASQAAVAQQQHHIDRLAKDLSAAEAREGSARERLEVVHSINVQLQCEMMQMMAACEGEDAGGEQVSQGGGEGVGLGAHGSDGQVGERGWCGSWTSEQPLNRGIFENEGR
jgi:hypothetical protein